MTAMARKKDPNTSKTAARRVVESGAHGRQTLAALALVKKYPGYTYRHLFQRHQADCQKRGCELVFQDAPSLMRRLSECAVRRGVKHCPISNQKVSRWYAQ
jgi:hypothetical protein